jgi:hypothetical protein
MPKFSDVKVKLNIPGFGGVEGTWHADKDEQKAAWEMYVELVTRISVVELREDQGLLREALSSLYSLFGITRDILKRYGPGVAMPKRMDGISFGYLAVVVLNNVLRPVLAKWHPLLQAHESKNKDGISTAEHERKWKQAKELRQEINQVRLTLIEYANLLAEVAQVPSLIVTKEDK